jgi:hypothetical protein
MNETANPMFSEEWLYTNTETFNRFVDSFYDAASVLPSNMRGPVVETVLEYIGQLRGFSWPDVAQVLGERINARAERIDALLQRPDTIGRAVRAESKRKRFKILARDNFTCQYCGRSAPDVRLHVDHVIPVCKGGTAEEQNLKTACEDCNMGKSGIVYNETLNKT